jgi:valyl-tRNA synthetase
LRLLAPILPFVTEEVWSWWRSGSIHNASWPGRAELGPVAADPSAGGVSVLEVASEVLGQIRKAKTEAKRSMRSPVAVLSVTDTRERIAALELAADDVRDAGGVQTLNTAVCADPADAAVDVELAEDG